MTTITTRVASNRIRVNGDLSAGSGQLGLYASISGATTSLNLLAPSGGITRYFSSYELVFSGATATYSITLPPINTANVAFGWKARIFARVPILATIGVGTSQQLNIVSSSGTTLYTFNCITANGSLSVTDTGITFSITAIGPGIDDWLIEAEEPYLSETTSTLIYNNGTSNSLQMRQYPSISKLYLLSNGTTNINVLIGLLTAPIVFTTNLITPPNSYDLQYYTFSNPSSVITFNAAGTYYIELNISLTAAGGSTTANAQFRIFVNGVTSVPAFSVTQGGFSSFLYILRAFVTVAAGDFIQIFGGRTAITVGTLTVNSNTILNINCCGV